MSVLSRFYRMDVNGDVFYPATCPHCHGRRHLGGFICGTCGGEGKVVNGYRRRRTWKVILRNVAMIAAILVGIAGAWLVFH